MVFSDGNITKGLCKQGQREPCKDILSEYLEICTDLPKDAKLCLEDQDLDRMKARCSAAVKPFKLQNLLLPAQFDEVDGIYYQKDNREQNGCILIGLRYEPKVQLLRVPRQFVGSVIFEHNYSANKAVVREKDGHLFYMCAWLFLDAGDAEDKKGETFDGGSGKPKPPPRAIMDATKPAPSTCSLVEVFDPSHAPSSRARSQGKVEAIKVLTPSAGSLEVAQGSVSGRLKRPCRTKVAHPEVAGAEEELECIEDLAEIVPALPGPEATKKQKVWDLQLALFFV